ncbi:phage tail spike protein, partial [uncultured Clostridium sp.]|uniref:phage tail spike protein n=1 Tax=uncultured Clostridium sp. TaxID=59620 RepID=UPI00258B6E43
MLQLYGLTKNKLQGLKQYKDYCIESELSTGDKTLSFLYPLNLSKEIKEEGYIRNKTDEFVIKEVSTQGNWKSIKAKLNVEDLEGKVFESFDTTNETITDCINLALAGTGWIVGSCDVTRRRTVRKTNSSSWDIIQEARKVYRCELEFDTLNKKVNIYEKRGIDKGVYFLDSLNLKDLSIQSDSYDFYTRIIAKGKDNLKVTLENFQYSNKIKTYIWKDERYTDIESLTEDAEAKLDELSKPYRAYSATVIDLANISKEDYKDILSYSLGDIITLVSKENEIKEKQRIVKMVEYPDEPDRNTCEIANTTLSFEDIQKEFQDTTDTVNNITTDNGTVDGSTIDGISTEQIYDFEASVGKITDLTVVNARIDDLYANKANISELNAVIANVAELNATKANITDLNTINANIQNLIAADATINNALIGKADITELNAVKGTITSLDSKIANIETLVNGNLSSENIQAGGITSDKLTIANGFITNAMIASLDVAKINAGDISTTKFRIVSDSGNMLIYDNTIQISDKNRVRVQIGKDASNDYNMYVWDSAGKLMFDATGLKADGIKNKIIRDDMISDNANIDGAKINISSLVTEINKDTNTSVIKSSKVQLDTVGQTLEVAFNSLKTNVDSKETRNLFIEKNTVDGYYNDTGFIDASSYRTSDYIEVNEGEIYTLCKFAADGYHRIVTFDKDKNRLGTRLVETDMVLKYTIPSSVKYIRVSIENTHKYKVEKGGNPNPVWTAAPEDIDSSIESVKQITESNSTTINVMQGQITTAINNTQIVKDGQTILLKDDYNRTVATVNSINSTIGTHTTKLNELTGSISSVDTKINSVQRDLEGTKSTVSSHTSQINGLNSTVSTQGASITQLQNEIALKVEQTDITNAINNVQIGGRNLLINSDNGYLSDLKVYNNSDVSYSDVADWRRMTFTNQLNNEIVHSKWYTPVQLGDYTFSIMCRTDATSISTNISVYTNESGHRVVAASVISLGNGLYKIIASFSISNLNNLRIVDLSSFKTVGATYVEFRYPMLETGNKSSNWRPAPEDVDSSIANVQTQVTTTSNKVATIETNLSSITQRVSSTESTVSTHTTQLGTVDSRINTAKSSAISTASSDATSKANNAQTNAINSAKSYTDGQITTVNKTITDKVAEIKTTTDSITQRVSSTESTTSTLTTKVNTAQSTADSKAKVFTSTPTVPYKVGDLWTGGPSGDVMRCKVARTSGNYTASDWEKASKYTDDTKANAAQSTANTANATANANKTEITSTKNKVSTIETNLNSITSKVSSAEKNITTINGNITSLQNRMSSAEQKITSSAIISTVQSTINTAKNEAINSANSSTDNKLKSYATTSSLTQTANNITASFKSSGGFNLLKNSDAKNGSSYWVSNGGGLSITTAGINPFIGEKEFKTTFPSGMAYYTSVRLKSNTDYVYEAWIYTNTAITSNSLTPLHFWCSSTADTSGQSQCTVIDYRQTLTVNAYTKVYVHFRTKSGNVFFKPFIYSSATSGMICVKQISLSEGTIESAWTPHPDEVYSGSTMIDANGVTINNGALTVKNKSGSTVLSGDSNGNLNLYAVGSKFKFTATGQRVTEMYSDASGNGDVFTIKVPFYNKDSGFRLCTDTGVNLIEAYAKNGDVHRLKLHGFQTDNIKATYMVASKQLYRYDDSGIYWKPIYTRNENAGIKMIDKLGIVNKSSGGLYMQVDMDGGGAYGIDIWSSDINLKKNIRELNSKIKPLSLQEDTITGLELIKKIKHYEFDYDETKGFEGHIDCGYISQQLQEINSSFVTEVEQEDGTILLQPLASALLPHITKAMQQQQEKIEELENIILEL